MMRKSDIEKLSPTQIKDKYALKYEPTHVVDVNIPKDIKMETGIAGKIDGWGSGGETQYQITQDVEGFGVFEAMFTNPRVLP